MRNTRTRSRLMRSGLIAGAVVATGAFLSSGTATAGPLDNPLLDSTCSFGQVDAAAHVASPRLAAQLDMYPRAKADLQRVYDRAPADRAAEAQRYLDNNPGLAAEITNDQRYTEFEQISQQIADTCHNF
ncbi:hemophore-related protein [Aldersonia sp. NBC_00410]|uniref:hemophore-related protein n=1 Tax=Aldersonia sp. NBC_00410 TaxID=2975954 RepID=UPI0022513819|nr:hemophore-related protein [Aldersonia sp. NBC_00410]MCX5045668.1 hemophore-related protein [Aldersonia sp. NBC_00410]